MATPISIEPIEVRQVTPVDVSGVRDPGMRALVLLAASLGWNVIQKINNPVALVARDGTQRRLPTNTSIRMSVFQAALSTIMVHTEDREATSELIDAIVRDTKIDRDHERRLRLAIGETPEKHRQRLANEKAAEQKRVPDEHLTQQIDVPESEQIFSPAFRGEESVEDEALVSFEPPHDGQPHGALMSREPYRAHHTVSGSKSQLYESDSSYERVWQDGFKDYECQVCGRIFKSPKAAGSHRQTHYKAGEIDAAGRPAWKRSIERGVEPAWEPRPEREPPTVEGLVFENPPPEHVVQTSVGPRGTGLLPEIEDVTTETASAEEIIDLIVEMVAPHIVASRDQWKRVAEEHMAAVDALHAELATKEVELQKLKADWDALRGLIDGR